MLNQLALFGMVQESTDPQLTNGGAGRLIQAGEGNLGPAQLSISFLLAVFLPLF